MSNNHNYTADRHCEPSLTEWLGALWRKLIHRHTYSSCKNWVMLEGQLVCLRTTRCDGCGHIDERALLLIATAAELAEANSRRS